MPSDEVPRAPRPQPESSAEPSAFLDNSNNVQPPAASAPAKKTRTRKEIKPKFTPACENCRVKKLRCTHRRPIGQEIDTTSVHAKPAQSEKPEGPRTKRLRSTLRNPGHDDLIGYDTVPVAEPAEPAAQPGRQALGLRKRKRSRDEAEESAIGISANPLISGPSQPAKQRHAPPAANRRWTLQEISTITWCDTMEERFRRRLKTAKEQWRRLGETIEIAHAQFDELVEDMDAMGHILKEWDGKFPGA
ncbi:uncharacterized protein TRUGW13939_05551 [Talaromyces rugulosus]|uniref:Zn(2)-C6 fungal-type domain-containing protein n=1 Tax=Talaromyces rugulosus TaxID=121627 RepID=A0A7H8QWK1_TALRU|nr:uncharacterized protein TRUGW13939_05551 [Talaromyces rugulosus]QKX58429.1 hypothetical protein TRUGW13939_05551 [Talaromyces rugulosus]